MAGMPEMFQPADAARFEAALRRFDEENTGDPNMELVDGTATPRELVYSQWLTEWVLRLCPQAGESLRLAARCQHLCRWQIPRETYPPDRAGYLRWRAELKRFHAEKAAEILREVGYPDAVVNRIRDLNLKKGLPADPETQVLEDALCLVFLERQFAPLAAKTDEEKVINALKKTWNKMSPAARAAALKLPYADTPRRLLGIALGHSSPGP